MSTMSDVTTELPGCRVILDLANVQGSLKEVSKSPCTVRGIKTLFELFGRRICELQVVAPVMTLQHSAFPDMAHNWRTREYRRLLDAWKIEATKLEINFPIAPPGGLWSGEVGVDAIIALLALHYVSNDSSLETIIFSSDADLQGLRTHKSEIPQPLIMGFFDEWRRTDAGERGRFISAEGLQLVLAGESAKWEPHAKENEWYQTDEQGVDIKMSRMDFPVEQIEYPAALTSCVVDPYGLLQVGIRQLGRGNQLSSDTVEKLLKKLGFPTPILTRWTIPNIQILGVKGKLGALWKEKKDQYESLSSSINNDNDDLTQANRAFQKVRGDSADSFIHEFGKERLLNHRWMKQLTTGLISDLWASMQEARVNPQQEVVVLAGNLDLEHCLSMCSVYGPEDLCESLKKIYFVFGEPPKLVESKDEKFERWAAGRNTVTPNPKGWLKFILLTDRQLASLLNIDDDQYGRKLRKIDLGELTSSGIADPDTAIAKIPANPTSPPPQNRVQYRPSATAAATHLKINGTSVDLFGFRGDTGATTATAWESWYAINDESVAPLLLEAGATTVGRSRTLGAAIVAEVVNRFGDQLQVRIKNGDKYEKKLVAVDDLPYRFSPGHKVAIQKLDHIKEHWIVLDILEPELRDKPEPEPVKVKVVSIASDKIGVAGMSGDAAGEIKMRQLSVDSPLLKIGDHVLALEIFLDETVVPGRTDVIRKYRGLSSALPPYPTMTEPTEINIDEARMPLCRVQHWDMVEE